MQPTPLAQYDFNNYTSGASSLNSSVSGPSAATITTPSLNTFNTSTAGNKYLILYFPSNPADTTGGVQLPSLSNIRTLEMWVKLPTPLVERGQYLLDARNVTADSYWIVYNYNAIGSALNNSQIYFNTKPLVINSSAAFPNLASIIAGNGWFQIVIVLPSNFNNNTVVNFFMSNGQNQGLKAEVGEVTVYSSALTTEQVKTVYNSKCSRYSLSSVSTGVPNPVAQYDFNNYTSQATTLASSVAGIGAATINEPTQNTYNTSSATNKYLVLYYQNTLVQAGGLTIPSITGIRAVEMWVRLPSRQGYGAYLLDFRTGASDAFWITSSSEDSIGTFFNNATIWLNTTAQTVNPTAGTPRIQQSLASASASLGWFQIVIQPTSSFTDDIALFMRYTGEQTFPGEVADIYVYTTPLTTTDVKTIFNSKCSRYGLSPVPVNTSFGFAIDYSSTNNNLIYTRKGDEYLPVYSSSLPQDLNTFTIVSLNATPNNTDPFGIWRNGTSITSTWGGASANDASALQYSVGGFTTAGTGSIAYDYAESIVIQSVLPLFSRQKIEGYLAWKWSLVNLLPSTHPYKQAAPLLKYSEASPTNWTNVWSPYLNYLISLNSSATASFTQTDMGLVMSGSNKWWGAVLANNGKIYGVPRDAETILVIDPLAGSASTIALTTTAANGKWFGGVLAPNGKLYFIPYDVNIVLVFNPDTGTMTTIATGLPTGSALYVGGVLAPNGKIYCMPYNASSILIINTLNDTVSTVGSGISGTGAAWGGGVLAPNALIYGIPSSATTILIIDPSNDSYSTSTMGASLTGNGKWFSGVLGSDGKIYGMPSTSTDILIINPSAGTATRSTMGATLTGSGKWVGGVLAGNGKIYGIPWISTSVLVIDVAAGTATRTGTLTGSAIATGGVLASNGVIYGMPFNVNTILQITPSATSTIVPDLILSPYFNKY